MISSFAYRLVGTSVKSACFRAGVESIEVNPAYTSVTGAVNHARRRGIPVHQGAAQSGACSACPVWRPPCAATAPAARKAGIVRHLVFAGENPAREPPSTLFGWRHGFRRHAILRCVLNLFGSDSPPLAA